jgi:D-hydroxyproline dehydrogenase subunit beta
VTDQNVAIVGGGIIGLAYAWSAAERGHRVTIFERSPRACGASIRNFGMIWPVGQPAGRWHEVALQSRERWLKLAEVAGVWVNQCGSIHLAHRSDEWAVLQEFEAQAAATGFECELLSAAQVQARTPAANLEGLLGGLFSPTELCVNPRLVVRQIPDWLAQRFGVQLAFQTEVQAIKPRESDKGLMLGTSNGVGGPFDRVVICSGTDFQTLFADLFRQNPIKVCKLQMLKTATQPAGWRLGPHLASGLTLRHYRNFETCPSLPALRQRVADESPELDRFGIHVMASQYNAGEIILGDSHEYDDAIEPFDKPAIDELILRELRKIICLPDWTIAERWHGLYGKHPTSLFFEAEPLPNVHICTATGGTGMTLSFGLAEQFWNR